MAQLEPCPLPLLPTFSTATLPATELDRIKRGGPDAVVLCDQCGRILVR